LYLFKEVKLSYSTALHKIVNKNRPSEQDLDYKLVLSKLIVSGGSVYLKDEEVPKWFAKLTRKKTFANDSIIFGDEHGYYFQTLKEFSVIWKVKFSGKTLIYVPKINTDYTSGVRYKSANLFKQALVLITDILPPRQEHVLIDTVVTISRETWNVVTEDDPCSSKATLTLFTHEAEEIKGYRIS
jgi:hypothetical protein